MRRDKLRARSKVDGLLTLTVPTYSTAHEASYRETISNAIHLLCVWTGKSNHIIQRKSTKNNTFKKLYSQFK